MRYPSMTSFRPLPAVVEPTAGRRVVDSRNGIGGPLLPLEAGEVRSFDPVGVVPYWAMYRVLRRTALGGASVGLYDRVIIPLSRAVSLLTRGHGPGKNLVAVGSPLV